MKKTLGFAAGMLAVVTCLGEILWGGPESFHIVDVNSDRFSSPSARQPSDTPIEQVVAQVYAEMAGRA